VIALAVGIDPNTIYSWIRTFRHYTEMEIII